MQLFILLSLTILSSSPSQLHFYSNPLNQHSPDEFWLQRHIANSTKVYGFKSFRCLIRIEAIRNKHVPFWSDIHCTVQYWENLNIKVKVQKWFLMSRGQRSDPCTYLHWRVGVNTHPSEWSAGLQRFAHWACRASRQKKMENFISLRQETFLTSAVNLAVKFTTDRHTTACPIHPLYRGYLRPNVAIALHQVFVACFKQLQRLGNVGADGS